MVGAIPGDLAISSGHLVGGERVVTGSSVGNRSTMQEMLEFSARHGIVAQTEVMPMSDVNSALDRVRQNKARYRVVLEN